MNLVIDTGRRNKCGKFAFFSVTNIDTVYAIWDFLGDYLNFEL